MELNMAPVWVVMTCSYNPHDPRNTIVDIRTTTDRFHVVNKPDGTSQTFATRELALEFAVRKYGLHRAVVAMVPMITGNSTDGYEVIDFGD